VEERLLGQRLLGADPIGELRALRPDLLLNLSASPFAQGKAELRRKLAAAAADRLGCPVLYANQVGGNDELIFDGGSFVGTPGGDFNVEASVAAPAADGTNGTEYPNQKFKLHGSHGTHMSRADLRGRCDASAG
jgi:NAD+ synthase (glutamine-hydrolysing)